MQPSGVWGWGSAGAPGSPWARHSRAAQADQQSETTHTFVYVLPNKHSKRGLSTMHPCYCPVLHVQGVNSMRHAPLAPPPVTHPSVAPRAGGAAACACLADAFGLCSSSCRILDKGVLVAGTAADGAAPQALAAPAGGAALVPAPVAATLTQAEAGPEAAAAGAMTVVAAAPCSAARRCASAAARAASSSWISLSVLAAGTVRRGAQAQRTLHT